MPTAIITANTTTSSHRRHHRAAVTWQRIPNWGGPPSICITIIGRVRASSGHHRGRRVKWMALVRDGRRHCCRPRISWCSRRRRSSWPFTRMRMDTGWRCVVFNLLFESPPRNTVSIFRCPETSPCSWKVSSRTGRRTRRAWLHPIWYWR